MILSIAFALAAAEPPATWLLLFRDPAQGAMFMDTNSIWTRGTERAITTRIVFDAPAADEVAEVVTRIEIDCSAGSFRARTATGYDRNGRTVYAHEFPADRVAVTSMTGAAPQLIATACR